MLCYSDFLTPSTLHCLFLHNHAHSSDKRAYHLYYSVIYGISFSIYFCLICEGNVGFLLELVICTEQLVLGLIILGGPFFSLVIAL
jgi:hypothetical protein